MEGGRVGYNKGLEEYAQNGSWMQFWVGGVLSWSCWTSVLCHEPWTKTCTVPHPPSVGYPKLCSNQNLDNSHFILNDTICRSLSLWNMSIVRLASGNHLGGKEILGMWGGGTCGNNWWMTNWLPPMRSKMTWQIEPAFSSFRVNPTLVHRVPGRGPLFALHCVWCTEGEKGEWTEKVAWVRGKG